MGARGGRGGGSLLRLAACVVAGVVILWWLWLRPPRGVTLVAACQNRHGALNVTFPTWLAAEGVTEVVVVDWCSSPPLQPLLAQLGGGDARVRVLRVDECWKGWVLTHAFNFGFAAAAGGVVVKADCDHALAPGFVAAHDVASAPGVFFTGDYRRARDENERHLNGMFVAPAAALRAVGGYDERIVGYGWDDSDLYARLEDDAGLRRAPLDFAYARHVPHSNALRDARDLPGVRVHRNRLMAGLLPSWMRGDSGVEWAPVAEEEEAAAAAAGAPRPPRRGESAWKAVKLPLTQEQCVLQLHGLGALTAVRDEARVLFLQDALRTRSPLLQDMDDDSVDALIALAVAAEATAPGEWLVVRGGDPFYVEGVLRASAAFEVRRADGDDTHMYARARRRRQKQN